MSSLPFVSSGRAILWLVETTYHGAEKGIWAYQGCISGYSGKFHSDGLQNLYLLTSIIWVIKSKWMRWTGHVARMGE